MPETEKLASFRLFNIMILQKAFDFRNPELSKIQDIRAHEFSFDFSIGILPPTPQPFVALITTTRIFLEKEKNNYLGSIDIGTSFEITNYEQLFSDGKLFIPDEMLYTFITTVIGNTRGILFGELQATPLQNVYLPLIQTKQIMDDLKKSMPIQEVKIVTK